MTNQRKLVRMLGMGYVIIFVIANIIGSGVYKKVAPMAAELQSPGWIIMAWAAAGIITLFGALSNAEVAGLLADTGGDFVYLKKIYNRFFAYMYGWSLFTVIQTATISSLAYVFTQSLNNIIPIPEIFPSLREFSVAGIFYPFQNSGIKLVAIVLILLLTFINVSGLKTGAGVSKALFFIVCAGLLLIVAFGLSSPDARPISHLNDGTLASGTVTVSSFFTAMLAAFWAYQGWGSVGFIGGEVKSPNRNIPRGIIIGTFIVIAVYLLVNITYLSLLSIPELTAINDSGNQIAAVEAVRSFWGEGGVIFISLLILVTTLGCTHASILTGARPYYAMAREKLFISGMEKINSRNVPGNSLLWQGIWASVLVLSGTFDQLTDMVIFSVFIFYGATTLGVIILRYRMPNAERPYKVWGYPVVPVLYILFCVGLVINTFITRPREAAIGMILILSGIPVYYLMKRKYSKAKDQLRD
jgi:basic amino acid/polyamine antiporter, APA family